MTMSADMCYRRLARFKQHHVEQLCALFQHEWWTHGRTLDETARLVKHSQVCIGLVDRADELVAFARVLTDFVIKALVFDVIASTRHRGQSLGHRLMSEILFDERLAGVRHFELYCLPDMEPFYAKFGFTTEVSGTRLMRRITPVPVASSERA